MCRWRMMEKNTWTDREIKKYYMEPIRRKISYKQLKKEGRLTGLVTSWVGTAF
jgi:hypothetical protein